MATIHVRQLDDGVVQDLKRRAAANDRSLEAEVRHILKSSVADDMAAKREAFLALTARFHRELNGRRFTPSENLVREDRDRGHRDI